MPGCRRSRAAALVRLAALAVPAAFGVAVLPARAVRAQSPPVVAATAPDPQGPRTLGEALAALPAWNPAHGPLLAVDPGRVRRAAAAPDGSAFPPYRRGLTARDLAPRYGRALLRAGAVSVLAPPTMTVFPDKLPAPNLFEGMDRGDKVVYLLASLTPDQWRRAASARGIGASDLAGEQRQVFESLLPDPFRVRRLPVGPDGETVWKGRNEQKLSADERARVRLRLERVLYPQVELKQERGWTGFVTSYTGKPGTEAVTQDDEDDFDRPEAFGVELKRAVPNRPRPGQLDYMVPALKRATIRLDGAKPEPLGRIVKRAGEAAGLELHADFRIRSLPVWTTGGDAISAGDVLKALCLAVAGTFRRIEANGETAYVLTGDVVGMGERDLRVARWYADAQDAVSARAEELRRRIAENGGLARVGFAPDNPLSPSAALTRRIAQADKLREKDPNAPEAAIPAAELTPELRAWVRREAETRNNGKHPQPFLDGRVLFETRLRFTYVLPDGTPIVAMVHGNDLGPADWFHPAPADREAFLRDKLAEMPPRKPAFETALPPLKELFPAGAAVALRAAGPEEARKAVEGATRLGFDRLWLAYPDADTLKAAVASGKENGVAVWAAVSPLALPAAAPGADRNLAGEPASVGAAYVAALPRWARAREWLALARYPRAPDGGPTNFPPRGGEWLCPAAPDPAGAAVRRVAELAAVPGLAGLAVRETQAPGYEGRRSEGQAGAFDATVRDSLGMGYTPEMRLAFLREEGVDPIDLGVRDLRSGGDLRQPFFLDDGLRGDSTVYDGTDNPAAGFPELLAKWDAYRAERSLAFAKALFEAVRKAAPADLPVFALARDPLQDYGEQRFRLYERWVRADAPPALRRRDEDGTPAPAAPKPDEAEKVAPVDGLSLDGTRAAAWSRFAVRWLPFLATEARKPLPPGVRPQIAAQIAEQRRRLPRAYLVEADNLPLDGALALIADALAPPPDGK